MHFLPPTRLGLLTLVLTWTCAASVARAVEPARYPWVIGHRGGSALRPESTLLAYDFTLDGGATGVEFDVWLSSDGFPVCHHDDTVDRTTNGTGYIYLKTLAEILSLDAGSWFAPEYTGTPVPRFEDGLAEIDGRGKLLLDIKAGSYIPTLVQSLEDFGFEPDDVWIWDRFGTGPPFKALMPDAHVIGAMDRSRDREEWLRFRVNQGQDGINEYYEYLTKDYVDLVHSYGLLVMAHTVVSPEFQAQVDIGVDIIVAGNPTAFVDQYFPAPITACSDGLDNDGDGLTDHPDDPSCWSEAADTETTACSDGLDNDGDGLTDHPTDPGCYAPFTTLEDPHCSDGIDNNGDGNVDYPADAGCLNASDQAEQTPCANGIDDDGDGLTDYPADPGCLAPSSMNEQPECSDGLDNDGDGAADFPADLGCLVPSDASERMGVPACNDGVDNDGDGLIDHREDPDCLGPTDFTESTECSDGIDNDGDGLADDVDPDCLSPTDTAEQVECRDGLDQDGDGLIDVLDPDCADGNDSTESSPFSVPALSPAAGGLAALLMVAFAFRLRHQRTGAPWRLGLVLLALSLVIGEATEAKEPYVIALIPDSQTQCIFTEGLSWPDKQVQWIVDEKTAYDADPQTGRNIAAIVHLGDITEDASDPFWQCGEPFLPDWVDAFAIARTAGIPVIVVAGNHDLNPLHCTQPGPDPTTCGDTYRTYFGSAYWGGASYFRGCAPGLAGTYYGEDMNCAFVVPTGNGLDELLILTSEWHSPGTQDGLFESRDWVRDQLYANSHMPGMVVHHEYLHTAPPPAVTCQKPGANNFWHDGLGQARAWFASFSGHNITGQSGYLGNTSNPDDYNWACDRNYTNGDGLLVHEGMVNYQRLDTTNNYNGGGGDGLIAFVTIDEDAATLAQESCAPPTIVNPVSGAGYCRNTARETFTKPIDFAARRSVLVQEVPAFSTGTSVASAIALATLALLRLRRRSRPHT